MIFKNEKIVINVIAKAVLPIAFGFSSFYCIDALATQRKNPFGGATVNVHKREDRHIKTAALICVLVETKANFNDIKTALLDQFSIPLNYSDRFLIVDAMLKMCPNIGPKNVIDKINL